jgi:tRNA threonylcarbamoyladenosine biosynthesis protein TsaB
MRVLGIDTATWITSVGLVDGDRVVAERAERAASSHGEMLAPLLARLLADGACAVADLEGVAVSMGPGSFTGLRVGLATAKGLAFASGLPVVGVSTLDALARVADAEAGEFVCPILDARKGELYAALYAAEPGGGLERLTDDLAVRPPELAERIGDGRRCRFLGDGAEVYGEVLERLLGPVALVLPFSHYRPRGAVVAMLGATQLAVGGGDAAGTLEPHYVRAPQAQRAQQARNR